MENSTDEKIFEEIDLPPLERDMTSSISSEKQPKNPKRKWNFNFLRKLFRRLNIFKK